MKDKRLAGPDSGCTDLDMSSRLEPDGLVLGCEGQVDAVLTQNAQSDVRV